MSEENEIRTDEASDDNTVSLPNDDKYTNTDKTENSIPTGNDSDNPPTKQGDPTVTVSNDDNYPNIESSANSVPSGNVLVQTSTNPDDSPGAVSEDDKSSNLDSHEDSVLTVSNVSAKLPIHTDRPTQEVSKDDKRPNVDRYDDSIRTDDVSANPRTKSDCPTHEVSNHDKRPDVDRYDDSIRTDDVSANLRTKPDDVSSAEGQSSPNYGNAESSTNLEVDSEQQSRYSDPNASISDVPEQPVETYSSTAKSPDPILPVDDNYVENSTTKTPDVQDISNATGTSLRGTLYGFVIGASGTILTVVINILANGALIHCILEATCMQSCFARCPWFKEFLKIIFIVSTTVSVTHSLKNTNFLDKVAETASVAKGYFGVLGNVLSSVVGILTVFGGVVATIFRRVLCRCCFKKEEEVVRMPEVPERSYSRRHCRIDVKPDDPDHKPRQNVNPRDRW
eukprot:642248_1